MAQFVKFNMASCRFLPSPCPAPSSTRLAMENRVIHRQKCGHENVVKASRWKNDEERFDRIDFTTTFQVLRSTNGFARCIPMQDGDMMERCDGDNDGVAEVTVMVMVMVM